MEPVAGLLLCLKRRLTKGIQHVQSELFLKKITSCTYAFVTESEANNTNICMLKIFGMNILSLCPTVLENTWLFLIWVSSNEQPLLSAVTIHAVRCSHTLDPVKTLHKKCSALFQTLLLTIFLSCLWMAIKCMPSKPIFTGDTGGQFIVWIPQFATCLLCNLNQATLRPSNTWRNFCHVGVWHLTVL